jgi:hypothetical protein
LQLGLDIQPRHQPIENIRSRQLVSYPFILLSMLKHFLQSLQNFTHAKFLLSDHGNFASVNQTLPVDEASRMNAILQGNVALPPHL